MITQLEFEAILSALDHPAPAPRTRPKAKGEISMVNYAIGLAAAMRCHEVQHSNFSVLVAVARQQSARGWASIPQTAIDLRCTYQNVRYHLITYPDLWLLDEDHTYGPGNFSIRIRLTPAAIKLLASIQKQAGKIARQPVCHE